ncbi:MAG TPA: DUF1353 domain-containing protein [Chthoniobacterales bacterium]|nr:DUF1353 domain-containing protein [Chthoniobacterales bacterium]
MKTIGLILLLFLTGCGSGRLDLEREAKRAARKLDREANKAKVAQASSWGYFSGPVEARWEADGVTMVLLKELRYTDPYGEVWTAPAGARVNGASIPRAFWSLIGGPFEGKYRKASVLHDVAYERQSRRWEDVDRMFYNAMRCSGVGVLTAKTMYYALIRHGTHWKHRQALPVEGASTRPTAIAPAEVSEIQDWVRKNDPSLGQIEEHATGRQR